MTEILLTFDLEGATPEDYAKGYKALEDAGLSRVSANVKLPESSMLGDTDVGTEAKHIRDALQVKLEKGSGKKVGRIAVAVVSDWAVYGEKDDEKDDKAIIEAVLKRWAKLTGLEP